MDAFEREIKIFQADSGDVPFSSWLKTLRDVQARAIIRSRLNRLRLGNFGDSKSVGDGVFELRIKFGPGYRIYFADDGLSVILILWGGDKSSQDSDILKAKLFWNLYRSRSDA